MNSRNGLELGRRRSGEGTAPDRHRRVAGVVFALLLLVATGCVTSDGDVPDEGTRAKAIAARDVGVHHLSKGHLAMGIRQLQLAASLNPDDHRTQIALGEGYRRKGRMEEAEVHLQAALRLDPGNQQTLLNLAALHLQLERYEETIVESDALVEDPLFAQPWKALTNKGWALYKLGRREEARVALKEALEFQYEYWPALLNLGILERSEGHQLQAIEYFGHVIELGLGFGPEAEANYRLGELYVALGNRGKAIAHFDAVLEHSPEGSWARQSKSYLAVLR
jgi:tetratricopeptide (TPR) repeat protein